MQHYSERFNAYCVGGMHPYAEYNNMGEQMRAWLRQVMLQAVESFEKSYAPFPHSLRERYLQNDPIAMIASYTKPAPDFTAALKKITVPILLYYGSKEQYRDKIQQAQQYLQNGEAIILKDLGGKKADQYVKDFLKRYNAP